MVSATTSQPPIPPDSGKLARKYSEWYGTHDGILYEAAQRSEVMRFLSPVPAGSRLLSLGCGKGRWGRFFASLGYNVVAVDFSSAILRVPQSARPGGMVVRAGQTAALPFKDGSFDVAAAIGTLSMLPDPSGTVEEMARCVKVGGAIVIGTPNRSWSRNVGTEGNDRGVSMPVRPFAPEELRQLLEPWGTVRMIAADPQRCVLGKTRSQADASGRKRELDGPFIVAEVRRLQVARKTSMRNTTQHESMRGSS